MFLVELKNFILIGILSLLMVLPINHHAFLQINKSGKFKIELWKFYIFKILKHCWKLSKYFYNLSKIRSIILTLHFKNAFKCISGFTGKKFDNLMFICLVWLKNGQVIKKRIRKIIIIRKIILISSFQYS